MKSSTFTYKDQDDIEIFVYKWEPDNGQAKAVVQIVHGVAEHALRYQGFAEYLTTKGFICYAGDYRGHGKSVVDGNLGHFGPNGWRGNVNSIHELTNIIKKENVNLPVFFFGHSLGSIFGQDILQEFGSDYKGAILSATTGYANLITKKVGGFLARRTAKKGPTKPNQQMHDMIMKPLNKPWAKEPGATEFEWICSVKEVKDQYIADPLCGFVEPASYFVNLLEGTGKIWNKSNEQKIPHDLPIFFIAGEQDQLAMANNSMNKLIKRYKSYGISDIEQKIYPNRRHETLNETNKEEVYEDIANWVDKHL